VKGERDLRRNHGNWSWFETRALLFIVGCILAIPVRKALRPPLLGRRVGNFS